MRRLFHKPHHRIRNFVSRSQLDYQNLEPRNLLAANLIISEFVASNSASFDDGYGDSPDWIELHNAGDAPIDLSGHHLTDDPGNPFKWTFPASEILGADEYLVVFASSRNEVDPAGFYHTNFKLSAGGEYLGLNDPGGGLLSEFGPNGTDYPAQITDVSYGVSAGSLIAGSNVARYIIPTNGNLGTSWTARNFNADGNGFNLGRAAIGYENSPGSGTSYADEFSTAVPSGTTSVYLRVDFNVADAAAIEDLSVGFKYDDGFGVYLNGTFLFSENAANGLAWNATASSIHNDTDALEYVDYDLSSNTNLLVNGRNTLAIHALNESSGSSDFLMVPRLQTSSAVGVVSYLLAPTPGEPNTDDITLGPAIENVTPNATPINPGQALTVTADVSQFDEPVDGSSVELHYRRMFNSEVTLSMNDNGTAGDLVAGDGVYSAIIPGSVMNAGEMVRWYVTADDVVGNVSRAPRFADPVDSAEYFGTVVADSSITTDLPVLQWFVQNTAAASTDAGARASLFYNGEFYDNINVDAHGQSTRGNEFLKKSFDFDANSGNKFIIGNGIGSASDFNLLTNYADQTKIRHPLAYELYEVSGSQALRGFPVWVQRNGAFYGTFEFIEEGQDEFLERVGLDPNGALYKVNNNLVDAYDQVEKKSRKYEDHTDFQNVINGSGLNGNAASTWQYDNLDLATTINNMAVSNLMSNADFGNKNMYWYHDIEGTTQWSFLPWDQDLSFGHYWTANVVPPYFDNTLYAEGTITAGWAGLFQHIYATPGLRDMYFRRLKTLTDQFYGEPGTPTSDSFVHQRMEEQRLLTQDESVADANLWGIHSNFAANYPFTPSQAIDQLQNNYLPLRRDYINNDARVPSSQIGNPAIQFGTFDANPVSGLQTEEYIRIDNPTGNAVDISGWTISGGIGHTFKAGTVIPANDFLFLAADVAGFLDRSTGPTGGQQRFVQGNFLGELGSNETIFLNATDGSEIDSLLLPDTGPSDLEQYFRISEINYNPTGNSDAEYIEFLNTSSGSTATILDLSGVTISEGPSDPFTFTAGTTLDAGQRLLVVKNLGAFTSVYPGVNPAIIAGEFAGSLSNGGEEIRIDGPGNDELFTVDYIDSDPWSPAADGAGASLQLVNENSTPLELLNKWYSWRNSHRAGGTPGDGPDGANPNVVINEILAHTDSPDLDYIELYNAGANAIDVGGWFLSDDDGDLYQYQIPAGTIIPANGHLVFDESEFGSSFSLSSGGETAWVTQVVGGVDHFIDVAEFGATFNGQSLGRLPDGSGRFVPQVINTPDAVNSAPYVGPVTISEVNYHPDDPTASDLAIEPSLTAKNLEFVEIHNASTSTIDLSGWRLRGEVEIEFESLSLSAMSTLVVVSFDTTDSLNANRIAAFRNHYGIGNEVDILGGFTVNLSNSYGRVELQQPEDLIDETFAMVDEVLYDDRTPWPDADGNGDSLQRVDGTGSGNVIATWIADNPTPGSVAFTNVTPVILVNGPATVIESDSGTTTVTYVVSLSQPATATVTVNYATNVIGLANPATPAWTLDKPLM